MNKIVLFFIFIFASCRAQIEITGTAQLPGTDLQDAQSKVYRIHPHYCNLKTICHCYPETCNSCEKVLSQICFLFKYKNVGDIQNCVEQLKKDLTSGIDVSSQKIFAVPLQFNPFGQKFNGMYVYRAMSNFNSTLGTTYPNFLSCKKACANIAGDAKENKKQCDTCRASLCSLSGPCSNVGQSFLLCQSACTADLQFYDHLNPAISCKAPACTPVKVTMTAKAAS